MKYENKILMKDQKTQPCRLLITHQHHICWLQEFLVHMNVLNLQQTRLCLVSCDSTVSEVERYCVLKDDRPQVASELGLVYNTTNLTTKFSDRNTYPAKKKLDQGVSRINNSNRSAVSIVLHSSSEMSTSRVPCPQLVGI